MAALSSQAPFSTFQPNSLSSQTPAELRNFLIDLINNIDKDRLNCPDDFARWHNWREILRDLCQIVLTPFATPAELPWENVHEKIVLTEKILVLVNKLCDIPEDYVILFGNDKLGQKVLIPLLATVASLECRLFVPIVEDARYLTPEMLHAQAKQTTARVIQCMGGATRAPYTGAHIPSWNCLLNILTELLSTCDDLLAAMPAENYPLYLTFFEQPRVCGTKPVDEKACFVTIDAYTTVPGILAALFEIILTAFSPPSVIQPYLITDLRRTVASTRPIFNFLLYAPSHAHGAQHANALFRILVNIAAAAKEISCLSEPVSYIRYQLLLRRIKIGPHTSWDTVDEKLCEIYRSSSIVDSNAANIQSIVNSLPSESWGDAGIHLRRLVSTYLVACIPHLPEPVLQELREVFSSEHAIEEYGDVHEALNNVQDLDAMDVEPAPLVENWRHRVKTHITNMIEPADLDWMDDGDTLSDPDYLMRAMESVIARLDRPLYNPASEGRIKLAQLLAQLQCVFIHDENTECSSLGRAAHVSSMMTCLQVGLRLLDGPSEEVTSLVRRGVFDAIARNIAHHTLEVAVDSLAHTWELVLRYLKDPDRSVRLSAARCFKELVSMVQDSEDETDHINPIFNNLWRICNSEHIIETALIAVFYVGKIAKIGIMRHVVHFLINYIGNPNLILRGVAYSKLTLLSNRFATAFEFMRPFMPEIAPFVVAKSCSNPLTLPEFANFLGVNVVQFLRGSLEDILPPLYGDLNKAALEIIERELQTIPALTLVETAHQVLAYACLLLPPRSSKAITFIDKTMRDGNAETSAYALASSMKTKTLANIVAAMGVGDERAVDQVLQAIWKFGQILDPDVPKDATEVAIDIMRNDQQGILANLNIMLFKKSTSPLMRLQIARSYAPFIKNVGPHICQTGDMVSATFFTLMADPDYSEIALINWYTLLTTLEPGDVGPFVAPATSAFLVSWSDFSSVTRAHAKRCIEYIVLTVGSQLGPYLSDVADMSGIPELQTAQKRLMHLRKDWTPHRRIELLLDRIASNSITIAIRAMEELKAFLVAEDAFVRGLLTGDIFDPIITRIMTSLVAAVNRDDAESTKLRGTTFECIGLLGAIDPDRLEPDSGESRLVVTKNFTDEDETVTFALHSLQDFLVDSLRAASDSTYLNTLMYATQEVLKKCGFSAKLVLAGPKSSATPLKVRNRWNALPKHIKEAVIPYLNSHYNTTVHNEPCDVHPFYPTKNTYREWIQTWTICLIGAVSGKQAREMFQLFKGVIKYSRDVVVAYSLLPHLVLSVVQTSQAEAVQNIRSEILAVLEDQVNPQSSSNADKQGLCAQAVFTVLDHLNRWVRVRRQHINALTGDPKRSRVVIDVTEQEEELLRVYSVLTSIDQSLMAQAALRSKAYARALMCFEQALFAQHDGTPNPSEAVQAQYERLHEIYAHLDEPDGMEGISTMILSPSIEHQIREHESTGHWTSAQSCWEVQLQRSPNDLGSHVGLLRCLKNLGHYDTMRTHVQGVLTRHPEWQSELFGFQVESEWTVGDWDQVQSLMENPHSQASSVLFARILLAMRDGDDHVMSEAVSHARMVVGTPLMSSGAKGYRRAYDAALDLHLVHELEMIHRAASSGDLRDQATLENLLKNLSLRMDSTLPAFRIREELLAIRRAAFGLHAPGIPVLKDAVNQSWLHSAKLARKSGYWQTAYSATLQARQNEVPFAFIESARLTKASGDPIRALQELESSIKTVQPQSGVIDLTGDVPPNEQTLKMIAKAGTLRARWMHESDRFESSYVLKQFSLSTQQCKEWESGWFHLGQFQDDCYRALPTGEQTLRGSRMNLQTVKCFAKAMRFGSKYIYQTVPRLLTLWLDMADEIVTKPNDLEQFRKINQEVQRAARVLPAWKWYIAFPQIVSRVEQKNDEAFDILSKIIVMVTQEYPKQALWFFVSTVFTKRTTRLTRGRKIMNVLKARQTGDVNALIETTVKMFQELLALCDFRVREKDALKLSLSRQFPALNSLVPSPLLVPLQESLIAAVPPASSSDSGHQPFPGDYPTIAGFQDEIEVMNSLAKPRKITLVGTDGKMYPFLGKPQDDLRKDARLMDFYAIINKLLQSNSESRRRRLYIRTYGVVTLNETCGFIQWVGNTRPLRHALQKLYDGRKIQPWSTEVQSISNRCSVLPPADAAKMFKEQILSKVPPVFHEWFIENFSEPAAWFASRLAYGRTTAVMSMVGFIIGLGDRHGENILLDEHSGDAVHVDFNCLFEKGRQLEIPERVPFRLTQNVVDGLGITGVEGVFRKACEVSMQILRDHRDSLITVLDAFIHDPLSDWETERDRIEKGRIRKWQEECRELTRRDPRASLPAKPQVSIRIVSDKLLMPISKKFKGIHSAGKNNVERELSTPGLVQTLIQESTDLQNLGRMYMGWMSWL